MRSLPIIFIFLFCPLINIIFSFILLPSPVFTEIITLLFLVLSIYFVLIAPFCSISHWNFISLWKNWQKLYRSLHNSPFGVYPMIYTYILYIYIFNIWQKYGFILSKTINTGCPIHQNKGVFSLSALLKVGVILFL